MGVSILKSICLLRLEPSTGTAGSMQRSPFCLPALCPCLPHRPRAEKRRQFQRSISLQGLSELAHLPLVPMQQGRPLI